MNRRIIARILIGWIILAGIAQGQSCIPDANACSIGASQDANSIETILAQLKDKTTNLTSYQCKIEYRFKQPFLESESLRTGVLYYSRFDNKSKLRLNFETLKQEDEKPQKYMEQYIFDGVWLTHIDYQIKNIAQRQLAEPNEPIDAFDLASRNLPIIGFTKVEDLNKQFDISLVSQEQGEPTSIIQLLLKVKPESIHKDDYTQIDFRIDKKSGLPAHIVAVTTEEDIYDIRLLEPKVNQKVDPKVFEFTIPKGFGKPNIIPLEKNARTK